MYADPLVVWCSGKPSGKLCHLFICVSSHSHIQWSSLQHSSKKQPHSIQPSHSHWHTQSWCWPLHSHSSQRLWSRSVHSSVPIPHPRWRPENNNTAITSMRERALQYTWDWQKGKTGEDNCLLVTLVKMKHIINFLTVQMGVTPWQFLEQRQFGTRTWGGTRAFLIYLSQWLVQKRENVLWCSLGRERRGGG